MTSVITSRRERKKAAAREQIIAAAIKLFSRDGLDGVTVGQIAAEADVGKGTIYNHFESKEDIVVAFMAQAEARVQEHVAQMAASDEPLEAILASFIRLQLKLKEPYHAFVRIFHARMLTHTAQFMPYMFEMQKYIDPPLENLFRDLQARGLMRTDVPMPDLLLAFKTIEMGLSSLWAIEGPPFHGTEQTLQWQMKLFSQGMKPHQP